MWPTKSIYNLLFPELPPVQMHRDPGWLLFLVIRVHEKQLPPTFVWRKKSGRNFNRRVNGRAAAFEEPWPSFHAK